MSTPATTAPPAPASMPWTSPVPTSLCWPRDRDYLDGRTEIRLPSERLLHAYWDADILDSNGVPPPTIISIADDFYARFRIELVGGLWQCIAGDWAFDLGFTPIGEGTGFDLSDHLAPGTLEVKGWKGCETLCVETFVRVPAGTVPAERYDGTLYEVGAKFQLHCCGKPAPVVGYEALEEYQFYQ
jgi:hypothetical protein